MVHLELSLKFAIFGCYFSSQSARNHLKAKYALYNRIPAGNATGWNVLKCKYTAAYHFSVDYGLKAI